jgi:hypothetical protein
MCPFPTATCDESVYCISGLDWSDAADVRGDSRNVHARVPHVENLEVWDEVAALSLASAAKRRVGDTIRHERSTHSYLLILSPKKSASLGREDANVLGLGRRACSIPTQRCVLERRITRSCARCSIVSRTGRLCSSIGSPCICDDSPSSPASKTAAQGIGPNHCLPDDSRARRGQLGGGRHSRVPVNPLP